MIERFESMGMKKEEIGAPRTWTIDMWGPRRPAVVFIMWLLNDVIGSDKVSCHEHAINVDHRRMLWNFCERMFDSKIIMIGGRAELF